MPFKDVEKARAAKRAWKQRQRLIRSGSPAPGDPSRTRLPADFRIERARDVLALLDDVTAAVRADPAPARLAEARTLGFLAGVTLRAVEASNIEDRLTELEKRVYENSSDNRSTRSAEETEAPAAEENPGGAGSV